MTASPRTLRLISFGRSPAVTVARACGLFVERGLDGGPVEHAAERLASSSPVDPVR